MKRKIFLPLSFSIMLTLLPLLHSCYYDNFGKMHPETSLVPCDTINPISYSNGIAPMMENSCGSNNSCHGASNTSNVDLSTYAGVAAVANDGRLYSSVIWDGNASNMPKMSSSQISTCSIVMIKKWIDAGAPNN